MWTCNCAKMLINGDCGMKFYATEVTKDNICVKCEHYAVWTTSVNGVTGHQNMPVTVINILTKEIVHHGDVFSAAKSTKFNAEKIYRSKSFRAGKLFKPKKTQYWFIKGEITEISEGDMLSLDGVTIYAYDKNNVFLGSALTKPKMSEITGESFAVIYANLSRTSVRTSNGNVYTYNKDFDGEDYAKTSTKSSWDKV